MSDQNTLLPGAEAFWIKEPHPQATYETQNALKDTQPGATFRAVREIMAQPYPSDFDMESPSPWTEADFQEYVRQEPLPPNQSFNLPSEEQPTENQLHLNYL